MEITDTSLMQLVKFKDDSFGIRKVDGDDYLFLDLKQINGQGGVKASYWWKSTSEFFKDCRGTEVTARVQLKVFEDKLALSKDTGEAVK